MSQTILRLVRPYTTQVEFIAAEGWAIQKDGLVAVGEAELPLGTVVRCEVSLASGQLLLRVEGEVDGYVAAQGSRPGGPKLKIRRVTPTSKAFILEVLRARRVSQRPLAQMEIRRGTSSPALPQVVASESIAETSETRIKLPETPVQAALDSLHHSNAPPRQPPTRSGTSTRVVQPPKDRDELLERLRARYRNRAESA